MADIVVPVTEQDNRVGVGPWEGPWPEGDQWDPALLRDGDRRNVVDQYRYWRHDAIVADLDARRHEFHVAVENWGHDFNIGSVIRTANAFNAKAFHIVGKRRWNRRGAMVTDRYQHEHHHPSVEALVAWASGAGTGPRGIPLIGVDNLPGSIPLETFDLPRECILVFGQEGPGLSDDMRAACEVVLHIEQFGSTRSINAGAAAAVAMHAWVRRHHFEQPIFGQAVDQRTARASSGCKHTPMRGTTMTEYLVLLPASEPRYAAATDQEKADLHRAHTEFVELLERRGHKMTGGAQLTPSADSRVARGTVLDAVTLSDGPYAESAEQVGGYYLVETEDVDDLAQVCGRLMETPFHTAVEIRPLVRM